MKFQRYNKYEVMKVDDIQKFLNDDQKTALDNMVKTIQRGRQQIGKPDCNRYVVVNEDLPYAEIVWKLIEIGETNPAAINILVANLKAEATRFEEEEKTTRIAKSNARGLGLLEEEE